MTERVVIRRGLDSDASFVRELGSAAFSEYSSDAARQSLGMASRATLLVALAGERRVGFAIVEAAPPQGAHLAAIAVVEAERGRGVGAILLRAAEEYAVSHGMREVVLATADSNLAALSLFLKAGFRPSSRRPRFYARGQDAVLLAKAL